MKALLTSTAAVLALTIGSAFAAVPADWVLVHKDKTGNYYTSPVCSTPECSAREAQDLAFLATDIDDAEGGDDGDDDE